MYLVSGDGIKMDEKRSRGRPKKSIWDIFIERCPNCNSRNIRSLDTFKRKWKQYKNGRWEMVEVEKFICDNCNKEFWK